MCSWCQVKGSLSQDTGSPFQSQFMPPRCERSPPPPHTHLGIRCVLIFAKGSGHFALSTGSCVQLPFVQICPSHLGRATLPLRARGPDRARGPLVPVVAILAAGQRFGGSDVVSGQKKPATSQRKRAEVTLVIVCRAILGPHLPTLVY